MTYQPGYADGIAAEAQVAAAQAAARIAAAIAAAAAIADAQNQPDVNADFRASTALSEYDTDNDFFHLPSPLKLPRCPPWNQKLDTPSKTTLRPSGTTSNTLSLPLPLPPNHQYQFPSPSFGSEIGQADRSRQWLFRTPIFPEPPKPISLSVSLSRPQCRGLPWGC